MKFVSRLADIALAYAAVGMAYTHTIAKIIIPKRFHPKPKSPPPAPPQITPRPAPVIEAELMKPEEAKMVDHQFKKLHQRNYEEFMKAYGHIFAEAKTVQRQFRSANKNQL